jgi:probable HAF family extracellular repeat protein
MNKRTEIYKLATFTAISVFALSSGFAQAPRYTALDLGTLGGLYGQALAINNLGQVVGAAWISDNSTEHGFLYSGGSLIDLGTPDATQIPSRALGINDCGQIVGYTSDVDGNQRAFLYSSGSAVRTRSFCRCPTMKLRQSACLVASPMPG